MKCRPVSRGLCGIYPESSKGACVRRDVGLKYTHRHRSPATKEVQVAAHKGKRGTPKGARAKTPAALSGHWDRKVQKAPGKASWPVSIPKQTEEQNMTKTIKCCRCNGTGFVFGDRQCFRCSGAGSVVSDVFLRTLGQTGEFFGITGPAVNGKQFKGIASSASDLIDGYTAKPITEDQARKFFKRYGVSTEV